MKMITKLTPEQEAQFPRFVRKWTEIGLCTKPADRERAERAIKGLYALAKLREPRVIWLPCPISAGLAAVAYASLIAKRLIPKTEDAKPVYSAVRLAVGSAVYSAVESAVDSAIDSAKNAFFGGSLWSGYQAWADYFNEVCGVAIDRNYLDATESCGFYWTLDDVCFASERPSQILRDDEGRLHAEKEQSIRYPSGWGLWHWHGVQVPREVVESPESITVNAIDAETNAEIRRVMVERYGQARYLLDSNAKLIHRDAVGLLYRKEVRDDEPIVMVRVLNSTPEPDGVMSREEAIAVFGDAARAAVTAPEGSRFKEYMIRVPPNIRTAHQAVAWTFGLESEAYHPAIES